MPQIDVEAVKRIMLQRNYLFKHQIANLVGISYERLTAIIAQNQSQVEEEIVQHLCNGLDCDRSDIVLS